MVAFSSVRVVFAASCLSALVEGFVVTPGAKGISGKIASASPSTATETETETSTSTQLHGRRVMKRGNLGSIEDQDTESSATDADLTVKRSERRRRKLRSSQKQKVANNNNNNNKSGVTSSQMSPDLAKFLGESDDDSSTVEVVPKTKKSSSSSAKKSQRRQKQSAQRVVDGARRARIDIVLEELEEVLGERTGKVSDILRVVEKLVKISPNDESGNELRLLLSMRDRSDYRLAWVGSDEAICHLGSGQHKVPLARLQEVFMSCLGRNKVEILEVISLIGPFPNVKNVLQGTAKITSGGGGFEIAMDKMVDGTGKEIQAGTVDNIRRVDLEVAFCDERVILLLMPDESNDKNANSLNDDGKRVLLFVKEDDLDDKLEGFRVNELDLD